MSLNPDADSVVSFRSYPHLAEEEPPAQAPAETPPAAQRETGYPAPTAAPIAQPGFGMTASAVASSLPAQQAWSAPEVARAPARVRGGRSWVAPVAIGVVGVIAAGTLGYFLNTTAGQRDAALRQVASTKATLTTTEATLASTQSSLSTSQADLAARNAIAAYTAMYVTDGARVNIDYEKVVACASFGACRTAAQSAMNYLEAFQADRSAATVPPALANADAMLRNAISAAIAADQQLISGFDTFNASKVGAGFKKLSAAMLSMAKAEAVLGAALK